MCLVSFAKTANYSALKKLQNKSMPAWAYIVICDDCSHQCSWCYGEFNYDLHNLMSFDSFRTILAKLKEMGTLQISLAGGEPTEHPEFRRFVAYANQEGFLIHVVSHGEHIDWGLAKYLKEQNVDQVQINWQGHRNHDRIHGVTGSYEKARDALRYLALAGIETTANITVGKYNLPYIDEIMEEATDLNVTRLRVWETTGYGTPYLKGLEAKTIFDRCRDAARRLGYDHCLSYDPAYQGDVSVACLQFSNLYMYISSQGKLNFCGAVPNTVEYADFLDSSLNGAAIRNIYLKKNKELLGDNSPYCVSREGFDGQGVDLKPVKWVKRSVHKQPTVLSA
jgi:MoaA/NifB/PqqE/SkfB family radical SAM enzyme